MNGVGSYNIGEHTTHTTLRTRMVHPKGRYSPPKAEHYNIMQVDIANLTAEANFIVIYSRRVMTISAVCFEFVVTEIL